MFDDEMNKANILNVYIMKKKQHEILPIFQLNNSLKEAGPHKKQS